MAIPTLIYDDACPMCAGYTAVFQRVGWCGRRPFSSVTENPVTEPIDLDRARHEIPLLGTDGRVRYGLDAMTHVLAAGLPVLAAVLRSRWLHLALTPLYKIITYNRRLIAGTRAPAHGFDCAPDRHTGWRWTYIALLVVATSIIGLSGILLAALLCCALGMLCRTPDRLSALGQLVTVAFCVALTAALLPAAIAVPAGSLLLGVELHRRFA